jgi:hypothetical protein
MTSFTPNVFAIPLHLRNDKCTVGKSVNGIPFIYQPLPTWSGIMHMKDYNGTIKTALFNISSVYDCTLMESSVEPLFKA